MFKFFKKNENKEISTKEDYDIYLKKTTKKDIPYGFNNKYANQEYILDYEMQDNILPEYSEIVANVAENIQENVISATDAEDLGIKESTGLIVITKTEMASCLIETGFLSSTKERQKLVTDTYQDKIVEGICNGIKAYFEEIDSLENKDTSDLSSNIV